MIVRMRATGTQLVGYDKSSGRIVRRKLYADASGNEYVRLGRFNDYEPDAHVTREWFCDHILMDGAVER